MLSIKNLKVQVENKEILSNLNLQINPGTIHAIMGPNGSGKSTFSSTLAGHKNYKVINGSILFKGKDLLKMDPDQRACEGIFIAFQYPIEIPGVSNQLFLHTALNAVRKYRKLSTLDRFDFQDFIKDKMRLLKIPENLLLRSVNVDFSGGEKKLNEILQMAILEPELCVLDETDSGLDIDALNVVSNNINNLRNGNRAFIIITHYQRILNYIKPDFVHILYKGNIVESGNFTLVKKLEDKGYGWLGEMEQ